MAFKFIALFALVAAASASPIAVDNHYHQSHQIQAAPVLLKSVGPAYHHADGGHHEEEHYGPAQYEFSYSVHDEHTGDIKHQKETRHGDQVQGEYSLIDADGHRRTVKYSSDKHTGFVAEVHREEVHGYKAPVQASYHQGGESYGHGNAGYVQKIAVAPVHVATVSQGHSSGGHGSSYGSHGSSYGGHSQIVAAAPVYQKVVAAPVYTKVAAPVSHGHLSGGYSSGSNHGSSSISYGHNSGAQYGSHGHTQVIAAAPVYHKVAVAPVQHVTYTHGASHGQASSGSQYTGQGHTQYVHAAPVYNKVAVAAPVYHKVAVAAAPVHHITTSSAGHGDYAHGSHGSHSVSFSAPHHSYHY